MKKRILSLILILCMIPSLFLLASCGKGKSGEGGVETEGTTAATTSPPPAVTTAKPEPPPATTAEPDLPTEDPEDQYYTKNY